MLVELVVASGKKEQARCHARVDDDGVHAAPGPAPERADVVFTVSPVDVAALREGRLDLSVGFMRGQVKVAGDPGALLRLLPRTSGRSAQVPASRLLCLD